MTITKARAGKRNMIAIAKIWSLVGSGYRWLDVDIVFVPMPPEAVMSPKSGLKSILSSPVGISKHNPSGFLT
jgi:hypothetical protein